LASFIVLRIPSRPLDGALIEKRVKSLSAYDNSSDFKEGTKPETFRLANGCVYFEAGFEQPEMVESLQETYQVKRFRGFEVTFIGDGFLAVSKPERKDDFDWVKRFLEAHFVEQVVLDPIQLEDDVLRRILEENPDVFEIEQTPTRKGMETVDRVKVTGRQVTQSTIYKDYEDEPLRKVKVRLNKVTEGVRVAFYQEGKVTIFGESEPDGLTAVLKLIVDRIFAPYVRTRSFQTRLSR
jgi:hypothetical protein